MKIFEFFLLRAGRAAPFALALLALHFSLPQRAPAADRAKLPGLVDQQPASGRFVKTDLGYMVPYKAKIPNTEIEFEMVPVPGGKFLLGSPASEKGRKADEGPQIEVVVEPFWIGKYEVTWSEYKPFMNLYTAFKEFQSNNLRGVTKDNDADAVTAPSRLYDSTFTFEKGDRPKLPAVSMSQYAAKQYTKWISLATGQFYRLPWEAEWEYACRAGSKTAYCFGDDVSKLGEYAWTTENSDEKPHEVGQKKPNAWGLYDMHGNVAEWCLDELVEDAYQKHAGKTVTVAEEAVWPTKLYPRVIRGGSWDNDAADARSAARIPSNDKEWTDTDPNLPKSPWWLTDGMALSLGMRVIRPLHAPATAADKAKYWEADIPSIRSAADQRMAQGRGARGVVDPGLPAAIKKLEAEKDK
ncbi:MAG TPA: formylglycine-generating enzyme family protein [Pirellulales bacterium]|nr:formylglycine-generating enzyme family protein [Pirellulales bacterium]